MTMKSLDSQSLFPYLQKNYFEKLPHLAVKNPKIVVIFSGGNAVGKSTLAARIRDELQALVIENDALRTLVLKYEPLLVHNREMLGNAMWRYTQDLYPRLPMLTENGLIVRDGVIDWSFEKILPLFEAAGYELFIVRFELSEAKRRELLRNRGGKVWISAEKLEELFPIHERNAERFLKSYTPDVILNDETIFNYDPIIQALREKINSRNQNDLIIEEDTKR